MRKLFILSLIFSVQVMAAQTVIPGTVDDINAIKMQQDKYISAEFTGKSEDEAVDNVKSLLVDQIEYWVSLNAGEDVPEAGQARIIVLKRGTYFRAFAYVKIKEKPSKPENITPERTVDQESKVETRVETTEVAPRKPSEGSPLSDVRTFDQVKPFIETLEDKGLLIDYGKYATLPESGNCFMVVYDRSGAIVARLRRENRELRNMDTNRPDSFSNYPGCGAIWFRTFNGKLD